MRPWGVKYCGLYYKHITIVIDDSSIINKWRVSLTDDIRVIIYGYNMLIMQITGHLSARENELELLGQCAQDT
jgi:hypothetical protein